MSIIDIAILRGWVTVDKTDGLREQKRKYQREYYRKHHPPKPKKHNIQLDKNAFQTREEYYREYRKLLMRKVRAEKRSANAMQKL